MILLNFSHPLSPDQINRIETLSNQTVERVVVFPIQFNHELPFLTQLLEILKQAPFSPEEWQTAPILINLPSFNFISALLLAELHGRMGYFPPILRMRPIENTLPPRYEVAEIINLQAVRDASRKTRY